jgi:DedD protein
MSWLPEQPNPPKPMSDSQDAIDIKKRARRRLIGAVALVLFVVIVLPMVLDKEPKPLQNDLSVQIPRQDSSAFKSRVLPPPAASGKADEAPAAPKADAPAAAPSVAPASEPKGAPDPKPAPAVQDAPAKKAPTAKPATAPASMPAAKSEPAPVAAAPAASAAAAEAQRAQKALEDAGWVVPIGAFSNPDNVRQLQSKLSAGGVKTITEVLKTAEGEKIRVRGGPFKTKADAEKARDAIKAMGVNAGAVTSR